MKKYQTTLKDGDAGVKDTICLMAKFVNEYSINPEIKAIANNLKKKNQEDTAKAVFNYIVTNLRYVKDPPDTELVKSPKHTILGYSKYGDCDDLSVALATLLIASGIKNVKFRTIAWKKGSNLNFSHVYVVININGYWLPLDPTLGDKGFGVEVKFKRHKDWSMENGKTCWT